MYGMQREQRAERISDVLKLTDLSDRADAQVKKHSGGMKRRLEMARGLMHYPKVLSLEVADIQFEANTSETNLGQ
jgi:ABC-2 type transport system ATP-binding protein